jgi:cyanate lyase
VIFALPLLLLEGDHGARRTNYMNQTLYTTILAAKKTKKLTWKTIGEKVGHAPVWVASVCQGMNSAPLPTAQKIAAMLELGDEVAHQLSECPTKVFPQTVPTDPLIYRFYEIVGVYGQAIKQVIHEEFGDGIMSAIDFSMEIDRIPDPKGDRVQIILNGKFLPYKVF